MELHPSEAVQADEHGRDNVTDAELAFDQNGGVTALRVRTIVNIGAYHGHPQPIGGLH